MIEEIKFRTIDGIITIRPEGSFVRVFSGQDDRLIVTIYLSDMWDLLKEHLIELSISPEEGGLCRRKFEAIAAQEEGENYAQSNRVNP